MKQRTLTFGESQNITRPGDDAVTIRFPFSAVDSELIGSPGEAQATTQHRLTAQAMRSRIDGWNLSETDLVKELFEIGKRELLKGAAQGPLKTDEVVIVNTATHGATPPFDLSRIPDPNGVVVTVEPVPRKIGF